MRRADVLGGLGPARPRRSVSGGGDRVVGHHMPWWWSALIGAGAMESHKPDELDDRERQARIDDERAAARDEAAAQADRAAEQRDEVAALRNSILAEQPTDPAEERSRAADECSRAAGDRNRARRDREASRRDRGRADDDRGAAHDAVSQLKGLLYRAEDDDEVMILLGQAQGMIMAARDVTPLQALLELSARAAEDGTELVAAADAIVRDAKRRREGEF
jgi:hypothetical protein